MGFFSSIKKEETPQQPAAVEKKKAGKIFLIDFENVGDSGIVGMSKLTPADEVVIFYGQNNNSISFMSHEMILLANCQVTIEKCDKSAKNYLDFQLVSYLGFRVGQESFEQVVIVSKDQGFDAVVDFWKPRNINIARQVAIDPDVEDIPSTPTKKRVVKEKPAKAKASKAKSNKTKAEKNTAPKPEKQKVSKPLEAILAEERQEVEKNLASQPKKPRTLSESYKKKIRNAVKEQELLSPQYSVIYDAILSCDTLEAYEAAIGKQLGSKGLIIYDMTKAIYLDYHKK